MEFKLPELFIETTVLKGNKIIEFRPRQKAHSWVKNFYVNIFCNGSAIGNDPAVGLNYTDTGGNSVGYSSTILGIGVVRNMSDVAVSNDDYGILIGTGTTAVASTDYNLESKVIDGTGAGQMEYSAGTTGGLSGNKTFTITRFFANNSGGSITVGEIGLVMIENPDNPDKKIMLARDVLSPTVEATNNATLKVEYTITLTWP